MTARPDEEEGLVGKLCQRDGDTELLVEPGHLGIEIVWFTSKNSLCEVGFPTNLGKRSRPNAESTTPLVSYCYSCTKRSIVLSRNAMLMCSFYLAHIEITEHFRCFLMRKIFLLWNY